MMGIFGNNNIVYNETVIFVKNGQNPPQADLLFDANEILQVCNTSGETSYERGRDYEVQGRRVYLTKTSHLPFIEESRMFPCIGDENSTESHIDGKRGLLFSEDNLFPDLQPRFTYRCRDLADEPVMIHSGTLPKLQKCLKKGDHFSFAVFGDSISAGANATKCISIPPYLPPYSEQLVCELIKAFDVNIDLFNESVGSKCSNWGLKSVGNVVRYKPDFVILAWGMNDASDGVGPDRFGDNIKKMMQKLRDVNEDTEFLLVSTMCGNPDWSASNSKLYHDYRDRLLEMCGEGTVLADITSVWEFMLERKKYIDISGNGVNHPNDFGHMIYKRVIFDVLTRGMP